MYDNSTIFLFSLTVHFLRSGNAVVGPPETKYVITKFEDLPNFYEKIKSRNSSTTYESSEVIDDDKLCSLIFGNLKVIDPRIPANMETLKRDKHRIFKELFIEKVSKPGPFGMKVFGSKQYSFDNSPKPRTFLVNGVKREEKTFACVTFNSDWMRTDIYYVSESSYNVNEGGPDEERLFGRFIFLGNQMYALAEQLPVIVLINSFGKKEYVEKRNQFKSAEKWEDDPVCKLDSGRKIRLCAYVCELVYTGCEDKIAVEEPCEKRTFKWLETSYDEWMLTCNITHRNPGAMVEEKFFVARTYSNHEAFAFKQPLRFPNLWLVLYLRRVAVVIDEHPDGEYAEEKIQVPIPNV